MKHTFSAGGVVINSGKVLVVNQHGLSWSLPKGHIEPGEDARAAAAREIEEESGVGKLTYIKELGSYERHRISVDGGDDKAELKTITMFLYTTNQTQLQPIDPENPEARWVEPELVVGLLTHLKDKEFYTKVLPEVHSLINT